jgi:ubiquinone biosynthesis protein
MNITHKVKDVERFNEIIRVFIEEGFGYVLYKLKSKSKLNLHHHISGALKKKLNKESEPIRLRKAIERLGPTFIKFGQILSVRPDLIPKEYITELKKLQESTPETPFSKIKKEVETELGETISTVFSDFDEKPLASASIAQVHRAKLKSGELVAVKIQKPGAQEIITEDIEIMLYLAKLLEKHVAKSRDYNPVEVIKEFAEWTFRELDFRIEAQNIKKFTENMKGEKIIIPKVFDKYTTERILVISLEEGKNIDEYEFNSDSERNNFVANAANIIAKMVFKDGFFHADPHPGNIFVSKKGELILLDFGMVGNLSKKLRSQLSSILISLIDRDTDSAIRTLLSIAEERPKANIKAFKKESKNIIENWYGQSIQKCSFVKTFYEVISTGAHHQISFPSELVLTIKALLDLEGLALQICPQVNIEQLLKPAIEKIILEGYNPVKITTDIISDIKKNQEFYTHLPQHLRKVMNNLESGKFNVHLEDLELTELEDHMDFVVTNAVMGVTIVALLFSSAILLALNNTAGFLGIPFSYIELGITAILITSLLYRSMKGKL